MHCMMKIMRYLFHAQPHKFHSSIFNVKDSAVLMGVNCNTLANAWGAGLCHHQSRPSVTTAPWKCYSERWP